MRQASLGTKRRKGEWELALDENAIGVLTRHSATAWELKLFHRRRREMLPSRKVALSRAAQLYDRWIADQNRQMTLRPAPPAVLQNPMMNWLRTGKAT